MTREVLKCLMWQEPHRGRGLLPETVDLLLFHLCFLMSFDKKTGLYFTVCVFVPFVVAILPVSQNFSFVEVNRLMMREC